MYRHHLLHCHSAIYCPRCYCQFKTEEELDVHQGAPWPCSPPPDRPALEGLDKHQKRLLKPRDRRSEEERWEALYRICFPNDQTIPNGGKFFSHTTSY